MINVWDIQILVRDIQQLHLLVEFKVEVPCVIQGADELPNHRLLGAEKTGGSLSRNQWTDGLKVVEIIAANIVQQLRAQHWRAKRTRSCKLKIQRATSEYRDSRKEMRKLEADSCRTIATHTEALEDATFT